jgi:hypothetical protein
MTSVAKMQAVVSVKMASVEQDASRRCTHWPNRSDRDAIFI